MFAVNRSDNYLIFLQLYYCTNIHSQLITTPSSATTTCSHPQPHQPQQLSSQPIDTALTRLTGIDLKPTLHACTAHGTLLHTPRTLYTQRRVVAWTKDAVGGGGDADYTQVAIFKLAHSVSRCVEGRLQFVNLRERMFMCVCVRVCEQIQHPKHTQDLARTNVRETEREQQRQRERELTCDARTQ